MKGWFFFQNPNDTHKRGFECEVKLLERVQDFEQGFLVSTFEKDRIYSFIPVQEVAPEKLDSLIRSQPADQFIVDYQEYSKEISSAIEYCDKHNGKVVLSRVVKSPLPEDFSLSTFFDALCSTYNHSFNYCFSIEDQPIWVGATPEVLVQSTTKGCKVYSLAGSRNATDRFAWTSKEVTEQKFVTDEIAGVLDSLGLVYTRSEPTTVKAGNVEHLLSEFMVQTNDVLQVADELHPTPAVCGIPKGGALAFIKDNETHERSFYAGIIGWKKGAEVSLYVNLRCAEVGQDELYCYVGGGITKDSIIEKEWEETNFKSQTLLSVLKKN